MEALSAQVGTAHTAVIYDAQTDPNSQLGRPGQYTSKGAFTDSRIDVNKVIDKKKGSVELGGSVEVYPTADGARRRAEYIQNILKGAPMLGAEYDYLAGGVLLRLSGRLTPTQASAYVRPLAAITEARVTGPVPPRS